MDLGTVLSTALRSPVVSWGVDEWPVHVSLDSWGSGRGVLKEWADDLCFRWHLTVVVNSGQNPVIIHRIKKNIVSDTGVMIGIRIHGYIWAMHPLMRHLFLSVYFIYSTFRFLELLSRGAMYKYWIKLNDTYLGTNKNKNHYGFIFSMK